ncbi:MAG: sensor histidine kinase, partial [Nocardioidaceae bacterium]
VYHNRISALDAVVRAESDTVTSLVDSGQLPDPLPAPAAEPIQAQVVDSSGSVIGATPNSSRTVPLLPVQTLRSMVGGKPASADQSALGATSLRVQVTSARFHGQPVMVISAEPFTDVRQTLETLLRVVLVAVPIIVIAAGVATWLAVSSALRPVEELRAAADRIVAMPPAQAPALPVPPSRDEIARLAQTLNRMLDRLHGATERQRAFVADAAHELRSPIASILTQVDVALSTPTDEAEWAEVARGVRADAERVGRLADDLLLLAQLDAGAPQQELHVDVAALLGADGPPRWVRGDPRRLQRAVDNLLANARRHAHTQVEAAVVATGKDVLVTIDDDGLGIPAADRDRVFERWLRLDEARARDDGGAGLGLPIARSIARGHGGDVTIEESPLGGARAVLRLPLADPAPTVPRDERTASSPPSAGRQPRLSNNVRS